MEEITTEKCGCEFRHLSNEITGDSCCYLIKCKCKKHYDEQLLATWSDKEGHHSIHRKPNEVQGLIPLEVE